MFAAALDRADAVRELLAHGADPARTSKAIDLTGVTAPEETLQNTIRDAQNAKSAHASQGAPRAAAAPSWLRRPAGRRRRRHARAFVQRTDRHAGRPDRAAFRRAAGSARSVEALVEHGANVNALSPGDGVSPLLIAAVNGQFDIATYLLAHGADPESGATPAA